MLFEEKRKIIEILEMQYKKRMEERKKEYDGWQKITAREPITYYSFSFFDVPIEAKKIMDTNRELKKNENEIIKQCELSATQFYI